MLSSSNLKSGQADSYFEQDDYYSKEEGPGGSRWLGKGAEKLGLKGGVEKKDFSQVLKGRSPDGQLLFSREIDQKKRRAATDFTFSAPKSVSVAGLVQGDGRVIDAHHLAVERTLAILEERYAETRVMTATGRRKIGTGNLIAAVFAHGTSRAAEPQLHSHCVVMNATQVENGKWYSFLNDSAIAHKKLLGQIYQNELAVELQKLGYEIEQREHGQFDIKGYSKELLETFSTRRGQIEDLVAKWQATGKVLKDSNGQPISEERLLYEAATLKTRKAKPQIIEAGKLLKNWNTVSAMKGLTLPALPTETILQSGDAPEETAGSPDAVVSTAPEKPKQTSIIDNAIAHCGERDAIFAHKNIEKFVFEHHIGTHSLANFETEISEHPELITVDVDDEKKDIRVTTESALQLELSTIQLMQAGQDTEPVIALAETVTNSFRSSTLSNEQRNAIAASCASTDQVIGWQGSAGAGKTFGLNAFRALAESQGYTVSGYAPSSAAAHELGESLKIQTETVARLLISEPLHEETEQKKLWFVDEAGLLSMKNANELLSKANEQNARVVLVGDTKQLSSVEAGNPFRSLQAGGMQTYHLDEARRQKNETLRKAVQLVAAGQVEKSIDVLEDSGHISEISDAEERISQMADDFLSLSPEDRASTLLLAGTNKNRLLLTEEIRCKLQTEGVLGNDTFTMHSLQSKDLTVVQRRYVTSYEANDIIVPIRDYKRQRLSRNERYVVRGIDQTANTLTLETSEGNLIQINPKDCDRKSVYTALEEPVATGDRLKWTKNNRVEDTRNGQEFTVTAITPEGIAQTVDDGGNHRKVDLTNYQHVDYAWIATTYSSQGKTAERVMALMDQATVNKEAFYVATSRAKNELQLYAANIEQLRKQAEKSRTNQNVSDYLPLFELVNHEQSSTTADYARDIADDVGESLSTRQQSVARSHQPEQSAPRNVGGSTSEYVSEFGGVPQRIEEHIRWEKRGRQIVRIGETAPLINHSAKHLQQGAGTESKISGAAARLNEQVERTTRSRQSGSRWPQHVSRKPVEKPTLRLKSGVEEVVRLPEPGVVQTYAPIQLQPPSPESSLTQQLDAFSQALGYKPGDHMYVRALLPKNVSDELAISRGLKFEVENGDKNRLIPNTRSGYLTVGSWEFTHIRKNKEPAIHQDGLAQLTALNQEGRGIYFVVNPGGEKDGDITSARAIFWENDDKSKGEQLKQARTAGLPLGVVVETDKSLHCYSPLTEPLQDLEQWKQLQEQLIQKMDSDPAIRNSSRLMRLPGFDHVRVEGGEADERLVFTPVKLRHVDLSAKSSLEAIALKLPEWEEERWLKKSKRANGQSSRLRQGEAAQATLAVDNPWDIRNFSQHLNGDHVSQNGWLQVQCPHHGSEGSSGTSLNINESTGQYKCHSGCDSKDVYKAAWKLAEERGWKPPAKQSKNRKESETAQQPPTNRWQRYIQQLESASQPKNDIQIARLGLADGLSKKEVLAFLAKHSQKARRIYEQSGSTPAYNYVSSAVKAAQRLGVKKQQSTGIEQ